MARVIRTTDDLIIFDGEGAIRLPTGDTPPAVPSDGWLRYNTIAQNIEFYDGTNWVSPFTSVSAIAVDFVLKAGDIMTGSLGFTTVGTPVDNSIFFGTSATGLHSTSADNISFTTNGDVRVNIEDDVVMLGDQLSPVTVNGSFLGIGTTEPEEQLHIVNGGSLRVLLVSTSADNEIVFSRDPIDYTEDFSIGYNNSADSFVIKTFEVGISAGATQFTILKNGAIGTQDATNPIVSLQIGGTDAIWFPVGDTVDRPVGQDGMTRFNSTTGRFEFYENGNWQVYLTTVPLVSASVGPFIQDGAENTRVHTALIPNEIIFVTDSKNRATIKQDGKFGIGTMNPIGDVHIQNVSGENTILIIGSADENFSIERSVFVPSTTLKNSSITASQININPVVSNAGGTTEVNIFGNQAFVSGQEASFNIFNNFSLIHKFSVTEDSFINDQNGFNLGIGFDQPERTLHIESSGISGIRLTNREDGDEIYFEIIKDGSNPPQIIVADLSGTFGAILDIDFLVSGNPAADGLLRLGYNSEILGDSGLVIYDFGNTQNINHALLNNSDSYVVADNGNFGVGTDTPLDTLHVKGTVRVSADEKWYRLPTSAGNAGQVLTSNGSGSTTYWSPKPPVNTVQQVSTAIEVSGSNNFTTFFVTTGGSVTIINVGWQPGYRFEVITKVSGGTTISEGGGITINWAGGPGTVTLVSAYHGATFIAETSTIFVAIGRIE